MNKIPGKYQLGGVYLLLAAVSFVVYAQVLYCEFIDLDDNVYVTENQYVKSGLTFQSIRWAFAAPRAAFWHPLTMLSHMLDCEMFGLNSAGHHLTSLLLHIANTLLLFWVLKDMTGAVWKSAFVAALFALHPLHVESVAWVSERKDVLSTLFWILTMAGYVRYVRRSSVGWYLTTLVLFTLGLMAKPMLVTLPFVLLLLDYWPLERLQTQDSRLKTQVTRLLLEKVPFFILSAVFSIVAFFAQQGVGSLVSTQTFPLRMRIGIVTVSYVRYIWKTIWPSGLAVLYPHPGGDLPIWQAVVAVLLLLAVSILVIRLGIHRRYLIVGWLWYLGTLVPVIGFVQVGSHAFADRYTYVPLTGLFIIVAWGIEEFLAGWRWQRIILGVSASAIIIVLSVCTYFQLSYWRSGTALFEHALKAGSNDSRVYYNLGSALHSQGRLNEALSCYRKALRLKPDMPDIHYNIAASLQSQGRLDEAMSHYHDAIKLKPDYTEAHVNLGILLQGRGRIDEAVSHYNRALQINPDSAEAHYNLGYVLSSQGRFDEAVKHYREALRVRPNFIEAHSNIGFILGSQGKFDEAISHFREVLRLKPNDAGAHYNLGVAYLQTNRKDSALEEYKILKALDAEMAERLFNLIHKQ